MSLTSMTVVAGAGAGAAVLATGVATVGWLSATPALRHPVRPSARRSSLDRLTTAAFVALRWPVPDAASRRYLRRWAALVAVALVGAPAAALPLAIAGWVWARRRGHRARRDQQRAIARTLPDTVDLLALCTRAGVALPIAHRLVAARLDPPVGPALLSAANEAAAGRSRADALTEALAPLGDRAAALAHVLAEHLRYGVPLGPALDRLGAELRAARRRQAEEEARRVPVRLLAPLVACVLPAFGLLTVVPLLAASLRALPA